MSHFKKIIVQSKMAYTVNRTLLTWIQLRDGTKLAGKLWMPELVNNDKCAEDETYPAILGENLYPLTEFCGIKLFIDLVRGEKLSISDPKIETALLLDMELKVTWYGFSQ